MPRATSLHIGLNRVDPNAYYGWDGQLNACIRDARDMANLSFRQGLNPMVLTDQWATRPRVLQLIARAAVRLREGDTFLLTYSGHGGQVRDYSGEEPDRYDETWCLYDGELLDDEIFAALSDFAPGVRVIVLSDSCHSGTVVRASVAPRLMLAETLLVLPQKLPRSRLMPRDVAAKLHDLLAEDYYARQMAIKAQGRAEDAIAASVLLISGCQDNQTSMDGEVNGAFTEQVLAVWNHGRYQGDYFRFHKLVRAQLPSTQSPNLLTLGPDVGLLAARPFTK